MQNKTNAVDKEGDKQNAKDVFLMNFVINMECKNSSIEIHLQEGGLKNCHSRTGLFLIINV